jgi:hypothetical protein
VYSINSISGKPIRLTDERWVHIVEGHPELAGYLGDVLVTVERPDLVIEGGNSELLAAVFYRKDKLLVVVYKEEISDGFVITAFFTKRIQSMLKRKILWQKQK